MSNNIVSGVNFADLGLTLPTQTNNKPDSSRTDFLQLFVTQLKNQNPLEPEKGADFLAQLAQFSTVEGIKNMEESLTKVTSAMSSSQALQATSLVGKQVEILSDTAHYQSGRTVNGSIEVPGYTNNVVLEIKDANGNIVRTFNFNAQSTGELPFKWDGLDDNGAPVENGAYQIHARGQYDGVDNQLSTYVLSPVESVSINKNGQPLTIHVEGVGQISLDQVKRIS